MARTRAAAPSIPSLHTIFCSVYNCLLAAQWYLRSRSGSRHIVTVAVCPLHGITAIYQPRTGTIIVLDFVVTLIPRSTLALMLTTLGYCVRCHRPNNNGRCSYLMCKDCCSQVAFYCRLLTHRQHFHTRFGGELMATPETSLADVQYDDHFKIVISCQHLWRSSPVRDFGSSNYLSSCVYPGPMQGHRIPFRAISPLTRCNLAIDGIASERIVDNDADEEQTAAVRAGYVEFRVAPQTPPRMRWSVWTELDELGRHTELTPVERDPHHDWPGLGDIEAHVLVYRLGEAEPQKHIIRLPRRRLIVDECTFFLSDLSAAHRAELGLVNVPDCHLLEDPSQPLNSHAYDRGRDCDAVYFTLSVPAV
ncbi:hypothetical protein AURDEDRAFT_178405 [Auricularia subglabra TFB-10046 SS5]|uniref:Uncharacterized protein n=1 Tax=Auricularia subglabra (strain TFB-10046 / SS5) TaxID=717982 RepID=J0CQN0_AURST|nr:hypothetical protein AURDEDRAFT_178405 [Auricularia subglabra TFB-10046 SS5]